MNDYTTDSLIAFLELSQQKGWMNKNTAQTKRNSIASIFEILNDDEKLDVRELDVDAVLRRFRNTMADDFTDASLKSYKSRLASSIREYTRYKKNPHGYTPKKRRLTLHKNRKVSPLELRYTSKGKNESSPTASNLPPEKMSSVSNSHIFPIPIRKNCTVRITGLPQDLQASEAKKIAAVITALAMD